MPRQPSVFIPDKHGNLYTITQTMHMLETSHTWVVKRYREYPTIEELRAEAGKLVRRCKPKRKATRIDIDSIQVGTWEARNVHCPKAGTKTVSQVISEIDHEMYPDLLKEKLRSVERRKDKC